MAEGTQVDVDDLELPRADSEPVIPFNLRRVREEAEKEAVRRALALCNHKISQAAEMLGVSRPTLYVLLDKFGLK